MADKRIDELATLSSITGNEYTVLQDPLSLSYFKTPVSSIGSGTVIDGSITDAKVSASANIAQSKLNLAITDSQISSISQSKVVNLTTDLASKQAAAAILSSISGLAVNGIVARNATGSVAARSIAAGSTYATVTNGSGASGNPTVDIGTTAKDAINAAQVYTVGSTIGQLANSVCDGTADDVEIASAISTVQAAGSKYREVRILNGTYNLNANIPITGSDIRIILDPGVILKAAQRTDSTSLSEYRGIFYIRNSTAGATQKNIYINGGTIDCNNQTETSALVIWGAGNTTTTYATDNIVIENMVFKNKSNSTNSPALVQIQSVTNIGLGRVQNVKFRDCVFDTSDKEAVRIRGSYHNNIKFIDCEFKNIQLKTINFTGGSEATTVLRTQKNIFIRDCYFHDNMTIDQSTTVWDIGMDSRAGVDNFVIVNNVFDGSGEFKDNDNPHIQMYACEGAVIGFNEFRDTRQAFSLGYSNNATPFWADPNNVILIIGNRFIRVHGTITDYDQNTKGMWVNNEFYQCGLNVGQAYAGHAFDGFIGNLLVNMNNDVGNDTVLGQYNSGTTTATLTAQQKSCIAISGQNQYYIANNRFIDNRKLTDPASTSSTTVSAVSGGALSSRTYYYRFAYRNASGTTMASPSASFAVGANQLIKIQPIGSSTNVRTADSSTTPIGVSGIEYIDIYVGTVSGSETLQASIAYPDFFSQNAGWTEPTSGLVSGAALPGSNTTHALTSYGVYEATSGGGYMGPNVVKDNYFFGIPVANAVYSTDPTVTRTVKEGNIYHTDLSGTAYTDDTLIYDVTYSSTPTFTKWNGAIQRITLTGSITPTITNGYILGERMRLMIKQDGTGSRTWTKPSNLKVSGATLTLSTSANVTDIIETMWDGTNWLEVSRSMGVA